MSEIATQVVESLARHRERMQQIHSQGLTAVATLAQLNSEAIMRNGTVMTDFRRQAMEQAVEAVKKVINDPGNAGTPQ